MRPGCRDERDTEKCAKDEHFIEKLFALVRTGKNQIC